MVNEHRRDKDRIIEGEDLTKASVSMVGVLEKVKWIKAIRKVGDVEISDPVDDPM
jgi:hypothetical protein